MLRGKVLDISIEHVNDTGARMQQWDHVPGNLNQQFKLNLPFP